MAFTQTAGTNVYYEDQALSRTAPTTDGTDGVPMRDFDTVTVVLEANSTKTISGGTLAAYIWDDAVNAWSRYAALDITPTTSVRRSAATVTISGTRSGTRLCWCNASVTVSGGTDARVWIIGGRSRAQ